MADPNKGTVHVMEEELRKVGQGVFETHTAKRTRKAAASSPETKMKAAPANKSTVSSATVPARAARKRK